MELNKDSYQILIINSVRKLKCVTVKFKEDYRKIVMDSKSSILRIPENFYDSVNFY